jgi:hypothetical protein
MKTYKCVRTEYAPRIMLEDQLRWVRDILDEMRREKAITKEDHRALQTSLIRDPRPIPRLPAGPYDCVRTTRSRAGTGHWPLEWVCDIVLELYTDGIISVETRARFEWQVGPPY